MSCKHPVTREGLPLRVCLIGYACHPESGSEPGLVWNWTTELGRIHQVWLVYSRGPCELIRGRLRDLGVNSVRLCHVPGPGWMQRVNCLHDPHYKIWQRSILEPLRQLHAAHRFDVIHHVSFGTISVPPLAWRMDAPFVWGPVGGAQRMPKTFVGHCGTSKREEWLREMRVRLALRSRLLKQAAQGSTAIVATNRETEQALRLAGANDVRLLVDSGVVRHDAPNVLRPIQPGFLRLLWAGGIIPQKALHLALMAILHVRWARVHLTIAGNGPMMEKAREFVTKRGLDGRVTFLGRVPWREMPGLFGRCDALLFTSLRDSFGSVVMEAMGHGLPVITLDHQGVGTFLPPDASVKVPVESADATSLALARAIDALAADSERLGSMSLAARRFADSNDWTNKAEQMTRIYESVCRFDGQANVVCAAKGPKQIVAGQPRSCSDIGSLETC